MNIIKKVFGTVFVIILILSVSINAFAAAGEEALMPDYTPMPFDGTVISVDGERLLMNRDFGWGTEEMIVTISEQTRLLDAVNGYPVPIENLEPGERVRAYVGLAMAMSLPPIANGVVILCDQPIDGDFPIYTDIEHLSLHDDTGYVLSTIDGTEVKLDENTILLPYLTRNLIRMADLTPGKTILLWKDSEKALKIVVFPEVYGWNQIGE